MITENKNIRFLFLAALFVVYFIIADNIFGFLMKQFFVYQKAGKYQRITYTLEKCNEDIIIFGTSHADNHYDPRVFREVLNMSCYNAGTPGQSLLFVYELQREMLKRYSPKIIILNVDYDYLYKNEANYDRLSFLLPYTPNHPDIKNTLCGRNKFEKYKLLSKCYIYNSVFMQAAKNYISPLKVIDGFRPMEGTYIPDTNQIYSRIGKDIDIVNGFDTLNTDLDENIISAYRNIIQDNLQKNIRLYLVCSITADPVSIENDKSYLVLKSIASSYGIKIIDMNRDPDLYLQFHLFDDIGHLNGRGAELFSRKLALIIKEDLKK